jgi:hypothetical protein
MTPHGISNGDVAKSMGAGAVCETTGIKAALRAGGDDRWTGVQPTRCIGITTGK